MIRICSVAMLMISAWLSVGAAAAFPSPGGTMAKSSAGAVVIQVKHCKSKQSRCYANHHNY